MNKKMALILTTAAVMGLAGCSGQTDKTETRPQQNRLHRQRQRRQKLPQRQKRKMFPERSHYILPSRRKMHRS